MGASSVRCPGPSVVEIEPQSGRECDAEVGGRAPVHGEQWPREGLQSNIQGLKGLREDPAGDPPGLQSDLGGSRPESEQRSRARPVRPRSDERQAPPARPARDQNDRPRARGERIVRPKERVDLIVD